MKHFLLWKNIGKNTEMKPSELYEKHPESVNHDFSYLFGTYYNFLPEIGDDWGWKLDWSKINGLENPRITIKTIKYFNFDGRRFWQLATVWFDDQPIMITRNAGREGDDHATRFVTNEDGYRTNNISASQSSFGNFYNEK